MKPTVDIYINVKNRPKFYREPNKSGLVNRLLAQYYAAIDAIKDKLDGAED